MGAAANAWLILRKQGPVPFLRKVLDRFEAPNAAKDSLLDYDDARTVDWSVPHPAIANPLVVGEGPLTIAWIMSPPGEGSGGHQNIMRFVRYLELAGHRVRIYLHSVSGIYTVARVEEMLRNSSSYPHIDATIEQYGPEGVASDVQAIFATGWETAYPAFRDASPARRFYFVQDFEPYFYPVGSESVLAENTYRFGFTGITAGNWLATKLARDYGMLTHHYDFSADRHNYNITNTERRSEVFFYARPGTTRRGFELGLMTLDNFARERPEYTINLAGWDVARYDIPFPYKNLGSVPVGELNALYNRCAAGLVLSLTNMSLLPLELLAAGVIPVVNEAENNTMVSENPFIEYVAPSPRALADRLIAVVDRPDLPTHSVQASESLGDHGWDESGTQFLAAFEGAMRG